ncbi:MPHOSPH6 [Branchiostoma lanceolatum]|uniref:MPHOSPH6 protein n=1 Tax=Branchiostoma lanceolatum TaxID=7740 RepID=A0A8K0A5M8_BRALA|nr:MPHOSPH6 [Branchiostoma lanceolatum]
MANDTEKPKLSKNLMQMKFMQRKQQSDDREKLEEEQQRVIDEEHWVLDIPELKKLESRYEVIDSYVPCEDLKYGRFSFQGFNPAIEKIAKSFEVAKEEEASEAKEKEETVSDDEMARRYEAIVGTIQKKFGKKRHRNSTGDEPQVKKKKKKFLKPKED